MMDFEIGDRVQAVDELGRWEEARVITKTADNYSVSFFGWGKECDRVVYQDEIRTTVDPFHLLSTGDGRGVRRGRKVATQQQLDQIKFLCRGDLVTFIEADNTEVTGTVHRVDRFNKTVQADVENQMREVPSHILKVDDVPSVEKRPIKKKKTNVMTHCLRRTIDTVTTTMDQATTTDLADFGEVCSGRCNAESSYIDMPMSMGPSGVLIQTGKCYDVKGLQVAAKEIHVGSRGEVSLMRGELIVDGVIGRDIKVEVPLSKVKETKVALGKRDRDFLASLNVYENALLQERVLNAPAEIRKEVRKAQLATFLRQEMLAALKSRCHRRRFSIQACSFEDLTILGLKDKKVVYSYAGDNLHLLDDLVGSRWDVLEVEENFRFVTEVVFRVKDMGISCTISTAICRSSLNDDYRTLVKNNDLVEENTVTDIEEEQENSQWNVEEL